MGAAKSVAQPRLSGGLFASVILHGGLVAAFFVLRPGAPPPSPPIYRVQLLAAPPGPRAVGVVQSQPAPVTPRVTTPPKPTPPPTPVAPKPVQKTVAPKPVVQEKVTTPTRTKSVPKATTPIPKTAANPPASTASAPAAGGGPIGGRGADVANIDTPGIDFPYPGYTQNIVRQLILYLGQTTARYTAEVRFIIRRDGTVDPNTIRIVTPGNYSFDQRALGAVEAAGNAKAFGPLPAGFQEDILPVTFRFTPSLIR